MGRMVDEERTNSSTLKPSVTNGDVMLKFTVYGFTVSTIEPSSVCWLAYGASAHRGARLQQGFTMPSIKLWISPVGHIGFVPASLMSAVAPT